MLDVLFFFGEIWGFCVLGQDFKSHQISKTPNYAKLIL